MRFLGGLIVILGLCVSTAAHAAAQPEPRTILAPLSFDTTEPMFSAVHMGAEMVLNYQGLKVEYISPKGPYPDLAKRPDVRGVLSWLPSGSAVASPKAYFDFLEQAVTLGRKVVVMGEPLPIEKTTQAEPSIADLNRVLKPMGLWSDGTWITNSYLYKETTGAKGYEIAVPQPMPNAYRVQSTADANNLLLVYQRLDGEEPYTVAAAVTPKGGYVADGMALFKTQGEEGERRWIINPFTFFEAAFNTQNLPKPDTTTLLGNRMYFSHIDGDSWRSITQIEAYKGTLKTNAEVLFERVLQPNPDLPVSVAPIAAEIDPAWLGTPETENILQKIFALPQVEPSSHTYSHPFSWGFFDPANFDPEAAAKFKNRYPRCGKASHGASYSHSHNNLTMGETHEAEDEEDPMKGYTLPRAFGCRPVTAELETVDAAKEISKFAPAGKAVELVQWSGNTRPWAGAIEAAEEAGLAHINGGGTRFDGRYSSFAHVSPIGIRVGDHWQVYAPMSNENTYTNLWSGPYYGFRYLRQTLWNTGTPYRLKPMNVYYHTYSAEKDASLKSLELVLDYVRQQEMIPVKTSTFARLGQGFYKASLTGKGNAWQVGNRGTLQTVRFDHATFKKVDFATSKGVIGQRHFAGSLYVALAPNATAATINLTENTTPYQNPSANQPYIVSSHWPLESATIGQNSMTFVAQGYGEGVLLVRMPSQLQARVVATQNGQQAYAKTIATTGDDAVLAIPLTQPQAATKTKIEVTW